MEKFLYLIIAIGFCMIITGVSAKQYYNWVDEQNQYYHDITIIDCINWYNCSDMEY